MPATKPPVPKSPQGASQSLTRKIGPLPAWAWFVLLAVVGYYVYKHYFSSSAASTTGTAAGTATTTANPVPGFDAATTGSGGIGDTTVPSTVTNNYYTTAAPSGGGTSTGDPTDPGSTQAAGGGTSTGVVDATPQPSRAAAAPVRQVTGNLAAGGNASTLAAAGSGSGFVPASNMVSHPLGVFKAI